MKKKITALKCAFVFALMALSFPSYASDFYVGELGWFTPYFSITSISVGGLLPTGNNGAFEFSMEVLPIGLEHEDTRLGIWFSPLNFFYVNRAGNESNSVSLINMGIYWDVRFFGDDATHLGLGTFVYASYFFLDNEPHWDRYTFTAGLRGGLVNEPFNIPYFISWETGFRTIDGDANFFLSLKVDVFASLFYGMGFLIFRNE
jgi:hypothetical protein